MKIYWPNTITNTELWQRTNQKTVEEEITGRKWKWIGHTLRKSDNDITKEALEWNPQGKRKRGRPRNTWRRSVLSEAKRIGKTWNELKVEARNRVRWRSTVTALCSSWNDMG